MSRSIFNELGENRVINPRSGFSQFVDLSNNQTISGIKRFLNNLITNSNVNFNTSANIGRIVFHPNEPPGTGNIIMAVYTENENTTTGWKFDSNGNLYYFGLGLVPNKITFFSDGTINILNNFYTLGSIFSDTYGSYSNGDITFINNLALGNKTITTTGNITGGLITGSSLSAGSGIISTTGTISCLDISSNGIIYAKDINLQPSGYLNVNNITSSQATGSYQTAIALSNEFIDINNSSLDIIAQYIGFGNPQQTLTTASKYMYIKPLSTGDFEMIINNISNKILSSDWATTKMSSQYIWNFNNFSNQYGIILDPSLSATYRLQVFGTAGGIKKLYYNTSNELGVIETVTTIWKINGSGNATFTSVNAGSGNISTTGNITGALITGSSLSAGSGTISTTGTISCLDISSNGIIYARSINMQPSGYLNVNNITSSETTGAYITAIALSNEFIDVNNSSLDIIATYIGFASPIQTLTTASKYMYIKPLSTGNFEMLISNITNKILSSDWATTKMSSQFIWNFNNASNITNITLDATTTSGDRLKLFGVASGTKYLYYNTSNNIGVFNTSTGTSVWSIDGTTGNIVTIGSYSVGSLSATSFLCNSMSPLSGTVINIGATSEFNFLKSAGVSRVRLYPTSTTGDIMQITRVSDATFTSGYWYFNNSGNLGYNTSGVSNWELLSSGAFNALVVSSTSYQAKNTYTYKNVIDMENLYYNTSVASIDFRAQYIGFAHPSQSLSTASKYGAINPATDGNFGFTINNIAGQVLKTDWATVVLKTDYNFQCFGKYIYSEGAQSGDICGHWTNRTDTLGNPVLNVGNNWVTMGGMENNNASVIASGFPNAGSNRRVFTWLIENTNNSGKALGLACNRTNTPNSVINTLSQASGFSMMGYYLPSRAGGAYSFTGEHSSMVCNEEYDDIMNYNTDDFIGMVVCSSGKIYNLPYDVDGNTYTKQVDNIKSVDAQPMTRLSKKYKDKSVLGVISHIEKVGKNRNDLGATSWTGCLSLDKDERRRIRVACIGEGGIWITNEYGNIENGDYITTSNIAGYSTKQDDDLMHNYTIAKATMDCDFDIEKPDDYKTKYLGQGIYASYIACTFHCG